MKRRGLLLGCGAVLAIAACDWNRAIVPEFEMSPLGTATMNAAGVVPPSTATSTGTAVFRSGRGTGAGWIDYRIDISNIQGVTTIDLMRGAAGTTGTVVKALKYTGAVANPNAPAAFSIWSNFSPNEVAPLNLDSLRALASAGQLYVQVNTEAHPSGAIRGTVVAQ